MWLNLAAARGNEDARELRDLISASMTGPQIAEAQRDATQVGRILPRELGIRDAHVRRSLSCGRGSPGSDPAQSPTAPPSCARRTRSPAPPSRGSEVSLVFQARVVSLTLTMNRSQTVASSLVRETPEKPRGDAPKWTPHFGASHKDLRRWTLVQPVQDPKALLNPKVAGRHRVGSTELKDEKHLCRPFSDTPHCRELPGDLIIREARSTLPGSPRSTDTNPSNRRRNRRFTS